MINNIITFSVKNKLIIGFLTLALVFGGIWSFTKVPIDAVPDVTNNQVQVITVSPKLGTEDIEKFVTNPVELSMANLPGVVEIRSVSRFGLSLVTVVFEDHISSYLARELVFQKISEVKSEIPASFGEPELGPNSTGLGEILQYVLEVSDEFKDEYTTADLRTIHDWHVKRRMALVPGVEEVNSFGGNVKQYEIALSSNSLKSHNISIAEVFRAVEENNENTGGAYIEKDHMANFIRGEGLIRDLKTIELIPIKTVNGIPILIRDVATVQFGTAIRYGAFTRNGEGEAVGGMIMMLKGGNSNEVITSVKKRIEEIEKTLPEGITIQPFLDRSDLIAKTTSTVGKNLIEGALIVIFVLVFLLGNWRGGFIVASTIPLSLLFAFIMMNIFGVWANLMSLGAIDFGIIIDGAVIIVESSVYLFYQRLKKNKEIKAEEKDDLAIKSSSKMMNSAFFGQLIILIVFIPILALEGVEGKMFKPMALTFMFAMIGVMILCLTYVPMMSAAMLSTKKRSKLSWGDRFVKYLEKLYEPILLFALKWAKSIALFSILIFGLAAAVFTKLGGEFVPKLDEGDIAFHVILKPGSSLAESIKTTTLVEKLIKDNFPEAKEVLSRIGVADVPTDPMPMDVADCFITLKPIDEWTSASSKEELIEKLTETLKIVPGVNFEFSQPIEMRFNELITGVREDVAIKIFGEDLDVLANKAEEIGKLVSGVSGIGDLKVEATLGLPQITIVHNRRKLAQYGISVQSIGNQIETAFSGAKAGVVFEGEKKFDLVLRMDEKSRRNIEDVKNMFITLGDGSQIPLKELASVDYKAGPMQISRENTNRRTYVGINIRGRDVESVVKEIKGILDEKLKLPPGYYLEYGGAFENLERASNRLKLVVPIALGLIFILIFFALKSFKQTFMIYLAIPMAAIGGVFAIWFRDMPFSISAGIGFIVLFGVAVLNGLVLISSWNELKEEGVLDVKKRIVMGAKRRIRPILLTALTDIFGFLPMAISSSAGAEVQRPLATVVIGGMITATLLTLIILPILYMWTESKSKAISIPKTIPIAILVLMFPVFSFSQSEQNYEITTLEQLVDSVLVNNGKLKAAKTHVLIEEQGKKAAINIEQTGVQIDWGQYNSFKNDFAFSVNQSIEFPTVYSKQKKYAEQKVIASELEMEITKNEMIRAIREDWYYLSYLHEKAKLIHFVDSLLQRFQKSVNFRYEAGESDYLEKISGETKLMEVQNQYKIVLLEIEIQEEKLRVFLDGNQNVKMSPAVLDERDFAPQNDSSKIDKNPILALINQQIQLANANKEVQTQKMLPNLMVGYTNQSMIGAVNGDGSIAVSENRFSSIQAGITIPLAFGSYKAKIKSAKLEMEASKYASDYYKVVLDGAYLQAVNIMLKHKGSLNFYKTIALERSDLIIEQAGKSFTSGSINFIEYFQHVKGAVDIKFNHIETLNQYNQSVIALEYLVGE